MKDPVHALATAFAVAALLAACGGSEENDGISKHDYVAKANSSCAKHEKQVGIAFTRIIGSGRPTAAEAQRFLAQAVVPALRSGVKERAALEAPKGDEDEVRAINAAARTAVTGFERIAADRSRSVALMRGQEADPATRVDALNRSYGIRNCGGD